MSVISIPLCNVSCLYWYCCIISRVANDMLNIIASAAIDRLIVFFEAHFFYCCNGVF